MHNGDARTSKTKKIDSSKLLLVVNEEKGDS